MHKIGNLTAQAASNLNLSDFDYYVMNELKLKNYVRYVDDIIIVSKSKESLTRALPKIKEKLKETHQEMNTKKAKIDTAYHGVQFLGRVSYPYGYQKPSKQVVKRVCKKAKKMEYENVENLLAKVNSDIGILKKHNCRKLIENYINELPEEINKIVRYDDTKTLFKKI